MADTTGELDLRKENFSKIVKGFALQEYKLKQLCMIESSDSWTETYYKETATELSGGTGSSVKGVPRLAKFPYGEVSWTKTSANNIKYAMEGIISWEDEKMNNIPMIARTLLRIARAITRQIDTDIAAGILAGAGQTQAATATWNNAVIANRDPIQDILNAKSLLAIQNYNPDRNGYLIVHPTQYAQLLGNSNIRNAGQFYTDSVTKNGVVGKLLGLTVVSTVAVTAGGCQVVIGKEACTWKSVVDLTINTIDDPGIKKTIRAYEVGQLQVVNPNAICKITGV
jgi:hypothetical protein